MVLEGEEVAVLVGVVVLLSVTDVVGVDVRVVVGEVVGDDEGEVVGDELAVVVPVDVADVVGVVDAVDVAVVVGDDVTVVLWEVVWEVVGELVTVVDGVVVGVVKHGRSCSCCMILSMTDCVAAALVEHPSAKTDAVSLARSCKPVMLLALPISTAMRNTSGWATAGSLNASLNRALLSSGTSMLPSDTVMIITGAA
jgi:hypothetical protein